MDWFLRGEVEGSGCSKMCDWFLRGEVEGSGRSKMCDWSGRQHNTHDTFEDT